MGMMFFLAFLAIVFFIAMVFVVLSVVLLTIQKKRKRKGNEVKKKWVVIPIIVLIINIIIALIPVGYIGFLRYVNNSNNTKIIYAESGKELQWPMGEYETTTNWFMMNETKYIRLHDGVSKDTFFFRSMDEKREKPIANIKLNQADSIFFDKVMVFILTGRTREKLKMSTIYPLSNANCFELYQVSGSAGGGIFCPEIKVDSIKAYYNEIMNYDTENITCEYCIYTDKNGSGLRRNKPYTEIEKSIILEPSIFDELRQLIESEQGMKQVEISQEYIDLDEAAQPGTPIFGYDERELFAYSKDSMAYKHIYLALIDGQVYAVQGSGNKCINGYAVPYEMNQYIIDTVFKE